MCSRPAARQHLAPAFVHVVDAERACTKLVAIPHSVHERLFNAAAVCPAQKDVCIFAPTAGYFWWWCWRLHGDLLLDALLQAHVHG